MSGQQISIYPALSIMLPSVLRNKNRSFLIPAIHGYGGNPRLMSTQSRVPGTLPWVLKSTVFGDEKLFIYVAVRTCREPCASNAGQYRIEGAVDSWQRTGQRAVSWIDEG